jgi:cellulase/cellobiase CelA1
MTLGAVIVGALAVTTGTGLAAGSALNKPVVATSQARLPGAPSAGGAPDAGQSGGGSAECVASAQVTESWAGGYKVLVTVRNVGPVGMKGWTVAWQSAAGRQVDDLWDGKVDRSGTRVTVVNEVWNGVVAVDGSTDFGLVTRSGGADRTAEPLGCRAR